MIGPERADDAQESALMDAYMRLHFGMEPVDGTPAPNTDETSLSGEDEQFAAYMRLHFAM